MEWGYYSKIGDKLVKKNFGDFKLDTEKSEIGVDQIGSYGKVLTLTPELPLTKDELSVISTNPISTSGEYIGDGKYVCKKSNVQYINIRSTAGVNEDTGIFDPTDNYINWVSEDIVGEYVSEKRQSPAVSQSSGLLGGTYKDKDLTKFINSLSKKDINDIISHLENKGIANQKLYTKPDGTDETVKDGLKNNKDYTITLLVTTKTNQENLPKNIYNRLPGKFKTYLWYKVKFITPIEYRGGENIDNKSNEIKIGWVRSDNVEMCKKPSDEGSQTNYRNELLKRMPMKPLKDGIFRTESGRNKYKEYTQSKFYTHPGKI